MKRNCSITDFFYSADNPILDKRMRTELEESGDVSLEEAERSTICESVNVSEQPSCVSVDNYSSEEVEQPSCDISDYLKTAHTLPDKSKVLLIKERYPGQRYKFPGKRYEDKSSSKGFKTHYCQHEWFRLYPFISYSVKMDGIFCLACIMFPVNSSRGQKASLFISKPYRNWKDARSDLLAHSVLEYHKTSETRLNVFISTVNNPSTRIDCTLSDQSAALVEKNRKVLGSIIKSVEFCGRQGIALRGHREDETSMNQGNFLSLLKYRVDAGDTALKEHLESCARNATYISKTSQNQLLSCIKDFIQGEIVKEIKNQEIGPLYGIEADEVTDKSNWEQLGIILRYVKESTPVERLIEYVACEKITGESLCSEIKKVLESLSLKPENCRAQTYDGAGNMAGCQNGCAANFMKFASKALYYHCFSHDLNLALSKASSVPEVNCMLATITQVGIFFKYSPKRQRYLEKHIANYNSNGNDDQLIPIKLLCETRWVERHTCLFDFQILYEPLLECLESIRSRHDSDLKWDNKTVTDANGLLCQISTSSFIVSFQCARYFFGYTSALATMLQGSTMDIMSAYQEIQNVLDLFKEVREDAEKYFGKLYNESMLTMADVANIQISVPRICGRELMLAVQLQIVIGRGQFLFHIWTTWSVSYQLVSAVLTKLQ